MAEKGLIETRKELAERLKYNAGHLGRTLKRDDWPFSRNPPWLVEDVPDMLRWFSDEAAREATTPSEDDVDEDAKALRKEKLRKEIRKLNAQADAAETALARERGRLLAAAEVDREWLNIAAVVRNGFQSLASQIVPLALTHGMPHESAAGFQNQVEEAVNGILRHLSRDDEGSEEAESVAPEVLPSPVPSGALDAEPVGGELPNPQP